LPGCEIFLEKNESMIEKFLEKRMLEKIFGDECLTNFSREIFGNEI